MMIATLQKLPHAQVSMASNKSTPAGVIDNDYEKDEENPRKRAKEKKHPELLGLAKRRGNRQEQLSRTTNHCSYLQLVGMVST